MVAQARSISYGINSLRYLTGESHKKNQPEKIHHITDQFLTPELDNYGIWNEMKQAAIGNLKMKKNIISLEISPAPEYTQNFSLQEWKQLWQDFAKEFDSIEIKDKNDKIISKKTSISSSKATVWLHEDSKSGIPHLHAAVARVDENGHTNNDHYIHLRAQMAAENVALKRGWKTAEEIRKENKEIVSNDCMEILKRMKEFSFEKYLELLQQKGYEVKQIKDKKGQVRGYSIRKDRSLFKASELGKGRNLMFSKIEKTWQKLHPELNPAFDYTKPEPGRNLVVFWHDGKRFKRYIPEKIINIFQANINRKTASNWQYLLDKAYYHFSVAKTFLSLIVNSESSTGENREFEVGQGSAMNDLEYEIGMKCLEAAIAEMKRGRSLSL